jgi:hypothetical protein
MLDGVPNRTDTPTTVMAVDDEHWHAFLGMNRRHNFSRSLFIEVITMVASMAFLFTFATVHLYISIARRVPLYPRGPRASRVATKFQ